MKLGGQDIGTVASGQSYKSSSPSAPPPPSGGKEVVSGIKILQRMFVFLLVVTMFSFLIWFIDS